MYISEMSAFMQYWGQLKDNLGPLRFNFGRIYVVLDLTSPILGPSWYQLGPSGDYVAHKLSRLGSSWCNVA